MSQWMRQAVAASVSVSTIAALVSLVGAGSKWW